MDQLPLNTVLVATHVFLRVRPREGNAAHLAPGIDDIECSRPRAPLPRGIRRRGARARLTGYDAVLLDAPTWSERTMCGLRWLEMASHGEELTMLTTKTAAHDASGYVCQVCATRAASWT